MNSHQLGNYTNIVYWNIMSRLIWRLELRENFVTFGQKWVNLYLVCCREILIKCPDLQLDHTVPC